MKSKDKFFEAEFCLPGCYLLFDIRTLRIFKASCDYGLVINFYEAIKFAVNIGGVWRDNSNYHLQGIYNIPGSVGSILIYIMSFKTLHNLWGIL